MLLQTMNALKQERQMGQELSATLQKRIEDMARRNSELYAQVGQFTTDLMQLSIDVAEEMKVREDAIDVLIGETAPAR